MNIGWDSSVFLGSCRKSRRGNSALRAQKHSKEGTNKAWKVTAPVWANAVPFRDPWANSHQPQRSAAHLDCWVTPASSYVPVLKTGYGGFFCCCFCFLKLQQNHHYRQYLLLYVHLRSLAILGSGECTSCGKLRKGPAAKFGHFACSSLRAGFVLTS